MKKKLTCAYLYADGHAVILYEKTDRDAGTVEFAEIHERWTDARLDFKGRLCFSRYESAGFMRLAKLAKLIHATEPSTERGSENTRRLGIPVGSLEFNFDAHQYGGDCAHFKSMPSVLSAGYTYQPDTNDKFDPNESHWGITRVARVHRVKPAATPIEAAA
jgi:hypothetical protein